LYHFEIENLVANFPFAVFASIPIELKTSLSSFIENETILDYDREAELALQRLTIGDIDVNQLTSAWSRSYVEVFTLFTMLLCLLIGYTTLSHINININNHGKCLTWRFGIMVCVWIRLGLYTSRL